MSSIYATPDELASYLDPDSFTPEVPALASVLVREASARVRLATAGDVYAVDDEHAPADPRVRRAFREATCEQASAWALWALDPRKGAAQAPRRVASKSLPGGPSVSYAADSGADDALSTLASDSGLTSSAYAILRNAGLCSNSVSNLGYQGADVYLDERPYDPASGRFIYA